MIWDAGARTGFKSLQLLLHRDLCIYVCHYQAILFPVNLSCEGVLLWDAIYRSWVPRIVGCTPFIQLNWCQLIMKVGLALRKSRGSMPTSVLPCLSGSSLVRNCIFHGEVAHLIGQIEHDDQQTLFTVSKRAKLLHDDCLGLPLRRRHHEPRPLRYRARTDFHNPCFQGG